MQAIGFQGLYIILFVGLALGLFCGCEIMNPDSMPHLYDVNNLPPSTTSMEDPKTTTTTTTTTLTTILPSSTTTSTTTGTSTAESSSSTVIEYPGPPTNVTNAVITNHSSQPRMQLNWTISPEPDYQGAMIRYSLSTTPATTTDGQMLAIVLKNSNPNNFYIHDVAYNYHYYYTIFAFDTDGNYASGTSLDAWAVDAEPISVTNFVAKPYPPSGQDVELFWDYPPDGTWREIKIRYRTDGRYPTSVADGGNYNNSGYTGDIVAPKASPGYSYPGDWWPDLKIYFGIWVVDQYGRTGPPMYATTSPASHYGVMDIQGVDLQDSIHLFWRYNYWNSHCYLTGFRVVMSTSGVPTEWDTFEPENPNVDNGPDDPIVLETRDRIADVSYVYDPNRDYFTHEGITNENKTYYYRIYIYTRGCSCGCYYPVYNGDILSHNRGNTITVNYEEKTTVESYTEDFEDETTLRELPSTGITFGSWAHGDDMIGCGEDDSTTWGLINDPDWAHSGNRSLSSTAHGDPDFYPPNYNVYYYYGSHQPFLTYTFDMSDASHGYFCYWIRMGHNKVGIQDYAYYGNAFVNGVCQADSGHDGDLHGCNIPATDWSIYRNGWLKYCYDLSPFGGLASVEIKFKYGGWVTGSSCDANFYSGGTYLDDFEIVKYTLP